MHTLAKMADDIILSDTPSLSVATKFEIFSKTCFFIVPLLRYVQCAVCVCERETDIIVASIILLCF